MDFTALQTRVRNRLNMSTDDPVEDLVDEYVNEGLHVVDMANPTGWPWLYATANFTTTTNQESYGFSAIVNSSSITVWKLADVRVRSGDVFDPLTLVSAEEGNYLWPTVAQGFPQAYFVEGETLYIRPIPNGAYGTRVRYVKAEQDMVAGTDGPLMPARYHGAIVTAALVIFYETLQDTQRLAMEQTRLDSWVQRMWRSSDETVEIPRVRVRDSMVF